MKPSIGRIVHYVDGGVHYPAIVTKVWTDTCINLVVFANGSDHLAGGIRTSVVFDEFAARDYTWHWPERE